MIFSSGCGRKNVLCPVKLTENYVGRLAPFVLPLQLVMSLNIISYDLHQSDYDLLFPQYSLASRLSGRFGIFLMFNPQAVLFLKELTKLAICSFSCGSIVQSVRWRHHV